VLDTCLRERFGSGFRHYEHSLRIVERLEREGEGLNLTEQVRDGIVRHSSRAPRPQTLEGRIVRVMDRVAYINHDIDDALRAGLLRERDLPEEPIAVLGASGSQRIDALVHDMVEHSARAGEIVQGERAAQAMARLREFMFEQVYLGPAVRAERERIVGVLRALFEHYVAHPELLPTPPSHDERDSRKTRGSQDAYALRDTHASQDTDIAQRVTDYLAGMTDRYCIREYTELRVPRAFTP
jgi:dGTPase